MRTIARALAVVACLSTSLPAFAGDPTPEDISTARSLGEEGQAALDAKDYAKAEDRFARAYKLYPVAVTLQLGLARAQAGNGKLVAAQETYNRIIREGVAPGAPPAFKAAFENAQKEIDGVKARIGGVTINVTGCDNPKVTLDDAPVSAAALGVKRAVDPGSHTVKATADGCTPAEQKFVIADAGTQTVSLKLEKGTGTAPPVVAPVTVPSEPAKHDPTPPPKDGVAADTSGKGGSSNKTFAFVAFGVGGAGLILGAVGGFMALGKKSDLEKTCPNSTCPAGGDAQSKIDSYHTAGTLSTVGFIIAGVGAAAGVVLLVTAPKEGSSSAWVSPYVGPGTLGATGRF
jgi:hypothetical protein